METIPSIWSFLMKFHYNTFQILWLEAGSRGRGPYGSSFLWKKHNDDKFSWRIQFPSSWTSANDDKNNNKGFAHFSWNFITVHFMHCTFHMLKSHVVNHMKVQPTMITTHRSHFYVREESYTEEPNNLSYTSVVYSFGKNIMMKKKLNASNFLPIEPVLDESKMFLQFSKLRMSLSNLTFHFQINHATV